MQRIVYRHLYDQRGEEIIGEKLAHRMSTWFDAESSEGIATTLQQLLGAQGRLLPGFVMAAFIKTITNSWTTSARFGGSSPCPFGCGVPDGSNMRRVFACPSLHSAAATLLRGWRGWPTEGGIREAFALTLPAGGAKASITIIWHDIVLQAFHARKHGSTAPLEESLKGRVKAICRHSPACKNMLRAAYRGEC